jgi:DNA-binding NtrC family response regulator
LILDDEKSIRVSLAEIVSSQGFSEVTHAESVEQALIANKCKGTFDLYIVDLLLPGMHGTCFIGSLPEDQRKKILVLSGFVDDNVYWMCEHLSIIKRQIVEKPFDADCLRRKIEEIKVAGRLKTNGTNPC